MLCHFLYLRDINFVLHKSAGAKSNTEQVLLHNMEAVQLVTLS